MFSYLLFPAVAEGSLPLAILRTWKRHRPKGSTREEKGGMRCCTMKQVTLSSCSFNSCSHHSPLFIIVNNY